MRLFFLVPILAVTVFDVVKMKKLRQKKQMAVYIALQVIALFLGAVWNSEWLQAALSGLAAVAA